MKDAGPIRARRHCPPKDDQAAEGRGVPVNCPEMPVLAPARPAARPDPRRHPRGGTGDLDGGAGGDRPGQPA